MDFNSKDEIFAQLFPDLVKQHKKKLKKYKPSSQLQQQLQQQQTIGLNQSQMSSVFQSVLQFIAFVLICLALLYILFNYF